MIYPERCRRLADTFEREAKNATNLPASTRELLATFRALVEERERTMFGERSEGGSRE